MGLLESIFNFGTSVANLAREVVQKREATGETEFPQQVKNGHVSSPSDPYVAFDEMLRVLAKGKKGKRLLKKVYRSKTNKCLLPLLVFECLPHCEDARIIGDVLRRMSCWDVREVLKTFHYNCPTLPGMLSGLCRNRALDDDYITEDEACLREIYCGTLTISRSLLLAYSKRRAGDVPSRETSQTIETVCEFLQDILKEDPESSSLGLSSIQRQMLASAPSVLIDLSDYFKHREDMRITPDAIKCISLAVSTGRRILIKYSRRWPEELPAHLKNTLVFLPSIIIDPDFDDVSIREALVEFSHATCVLLCGIAKKNIGEYRQLMSDLCAKQPPSYSWGILSRFWELLLNCSNHDAFNFLECLFRGVFESVWSEHDGKLWIKIDFREAELVVGDLYAFILQCRDYCCVTEYWDQYLKPLVAKFLQTSGDNQEEQAQPVYRYLNDLLTEIKTQKTTSLRTSVD